MGKDKCWCRFVTSKVQSNKRNNIILEFNGKKMTVREWADELGIDYYILIQRVHLAWTPKRIITTPILNSFGNAIK